MLTKKTVAVATAAVTALTATAAVVSILGSEAALMERFPEIDPKVVVKAHRKILRASLTGSDPAVTAACRADDYAALDLIFLQHTAFLTYSK